MKLTDWMQSTADMMGPGALASPARHHGIRKLKTRVAAEEEEEDSTDPSKRTWVNKKDFQAAKDELFDMYGSKEFATGLCGCTLRVGETVVIEGAGKGKILSRENRILTVQFSDGAKRQFDQNFVHHLRK